MLTSPRLCKDRGPCLDLPAIALGRGVHALDNLRSLHALPFARSESPLLAGLKTGLSLGTQPAGVATKLVVLNGIVW